MGLFNTRNLRKAKDLLDKNRHKVGDLVDKAGSKLDQVSGGKTSSVTAKATEAAKKYSEGGVSHYGREVPVDPSDATADPAQLQAQANAASIAAANAVTAAATAATNLLNNAAVQAQIAQAQQEAARGGAGGETVRATYERGDADSGSDETSG